MKRIISLLVILTILLSINLTANAQGNPGKYTVKSDRAAQVYTSPVDDLSKLTPLGVADIPSNTQVEIVDTKFNMGQIKAPVNGWLLLDDLDPVPVQPAGFQPTQVTGWQKISIAELPPTTAGANMYSGIVRKDGSDNDGSYDFSNMSGDQIALVFGGQADFDDPQNPGVPVHVGSSQNSCFVAVIRPAYNGKVVFAPRDAMVEIFTVDMKFDPMMTLSQKRADLEATYEACRTNSEGNRVTIDVRLYTNVETLLAAASMPVGWEKVSTAGMGTLAASTQAISGYGDQIKGPLPLPQTITVPVGQFAVAYGETAVIDSIEMGMPNLCFVAVINGGNSVSVSGSDGSVIEFYNAGPALDLKQIAAWHESQRQSANEATCGKGVDLYIKN